MVVCDQFAGEVSTIEKLLSGFVATVFARDFATVFFFATAGFLDVASFLNVAGFFAGLFLAVGLFVVASAEVTLRFVEAIDFVLLTAFTGAFAGILFVLTFVFRIVFFRKGLDTTPRYPPEPVDANRL